MYCVFLKNVNIVKKKREQTMKPFSERKRCFQAMVQHTSVTRQPKWTPGSSISISLFSFNTPVKPKLLENFLSDLAKLMVEL